MRLFPFSCCGGLRRQVVANPGDRGHFRSHSRQDLFQTSVGNVASRSRRKSGHEIVRDERPYGNGSNVFSFDTKIDREKYDRDLTQRSNEIELDERFVDDVVYRAQLRDDVLSKIRRCDRTKNAGLDLGSEDVHYAIHGVHTLRYLFRNLHKLLPIGTLVVRTQADERAVGSTVSLDTHRSTRQQRGLHSRVNAFCDSIDGDRDVVRIVR